MNDVENLFLEVNKAIDENNLSEAKKLLEELLLIDPGYGRAHNHLGWIYETKIKNFKKADLHYSLAVKFLNKTYPVVYVNYAYLLIEYGRYNKALRIINEGLTLKGADLATLNYQQGRIAEKQEQFLKAYKLYKLAQKKSFNKDFSVMLNGEIFRVKKKLNVFQKIFRQV